MSVGETPFTQTVSGVLIMSNQVSHVLGVRYMALIQCPECNGQVSEHASACPHCGNPFKVEEATKLKIDMSPACPACGSRNLGSGKRGANVGLGLAGVVAAGLPGMVVGALAKSGDIMLHCTNCGHKWKAGSPLNRARGSIMSATQQLYEQDPSIADAHSAAMYKKLLEEDDTRRPGSRKKMKPAIRAKLERRYRGHSIGGESALMLVHYLEEVDEHDALPPRKQNQAFRSSLVELVEKRREELGELAKEVEGNQ